MSFDFATTGLDMNPKWQVAAEICHQWVTAHMGHVFGPERVNNFMHNQPVGAAKRVFDNCDDWTEESVTLLLLGPAKDDLLDDPQKEERAREFFGDRTIDLLKSLYDPALAADTDMQRDAGRIFICEAISSMNDQMVGRARIDAHHQRRWTMIRNFEQGFAVLKGQDPKLDAIFEDTMVKSKDALTKLDQAAAAKKAPKPPGM